MNAVFYMASAVAILATLLAISRREAVHALLYLIVSLLAVALVFFALGAPLIAAMEVIVYAGAIVILFIFVVMMLNLGEVAREQENVWLSPGIWRVPGIMALLLTGLLVYALFQEDRWLPVDRVVDIKVVAASLFGPYVLMVELASILLLAGLVGAYYLVWRGPIRRPGRRD
ncbi:MAG TPA: NADH-quinone oxidoreductase subunit J [Candidatus Hydrogenedentes bacterium]|nr:NADH-quinone oxidoreductase subunit J [Candidatus Hydrogenedentota bacterium]